MKKCIDGNGKDTTQLLLQYLMSRQPLYTAELFQFRAPRSTGTPFATPLLLTDAAGPLIWSNVGSFKSAKITHSEIETVIGLEAQAVKIDWSMGTGPYLYASDGTTPIETYLTAFREGLFDHGLVRIWRTYMPAPGNANTFGAVMLYQGRIGDVETDSFGVHISCTSVLEVLNRKIPPNLIEDANINAQWLLATNPVMMVVQTGSTNQLILAKPQVNPAETFAPGYFRYGHIYFTLPANAGELAGHYRQVQDSFTDSNGNTVLQLFEPLPFPTNINAALGLASPGEVFQAFAPHPQSLKANDPGKPGYPQYMGFQFVPRPEDQI